jgi:hypothetical protein
VVRSKPTEWTLPGGPSALCGHRAAGACHRPRGGYGRQMPVSVGESPFGSFTGRAVSARRDRTAPDAPGRPAILIVGPGCWPSVSLALNGAAGSGLKVIISAERADSRGHNPINAGILLVCFPPQTVAELQSMVNSDPGILLTVDICRRDVRARGRLVGRFEMPPFPSSQPGDGMARSLIMVQRLLGSAELADGDRIRLQRRFAAICDAMKAPGADARRIARRLDRFLADVAARSRTGLS